MNKKDKARLSSIIEQMRALNEELSSLAEAEREKFDNMPEGLQAGERGQAIEQYADALEEGTGAIGEALDELEALE